MTNDQLRNISTYCEIENISELEKHENDVAPSVTLDGNTALVSCCYWNPWGGLIRETGSFTFFGEKVYILKDFKDEYLLKYDCGFRF